MGLAAIPLIGANMAYQWNSSTSNPREGYGAQDCGRYQEEGKREYNKEIEK